MKKKSTILRISLGLMLSFKSVHAMRCGCMVLKAKKEKEKKKEKKRSHKEKSDK